MRGVFDLGLILRCEVVGPRCGLTPSLERWREAGGRLFVCALTLRGSLRSHLRVRGVFCCFSALRGSDLRVRRRVLLSFGPSRLAALASWDEALAAFAAGFAGFGAGAFAAFQGGAVHARKGVILRRMSGGVADAGLDC